jgi:hypothetical protein
MISTQDRGQGKGSWFLRELEIFCKTRAITRLALEFTSDSLIFWQAKAFIKNPQFPTLLFKQI